MRIYGTKQLGCDRGPMRQPGQTEAVTSNGICTGFCHSVAECTGTHSFRSKSLAVTSGGGVALTPAQRPQRGVGRLTLSGANPSEAPLLPSP